MEIVKRIMGKKKFELKENGGIYQYKTDNIDIIFLLIDDGWFTMKIKILLSIDPGPEDLKTGEIVHLKNVFDGFLREKCVTRLH